MLATGVLSMGLIVPSGMHALAADGHPVALPAIDFPAAKRISFTMNGFTESSISFAATVGEFLADRRITPAADDFLNVDPSTPLSDGLAVEYRPALPVTIDDGAGIRTVRSTAPTVAKLLAENGVRLAKHDRVEPALAAPLAADLAVRVIRVKTWTERIRHRIAATIEKRYDLDWPAGHTQVVDPGSPGIVEDLVKYDLRERRAAPVSTLVSTRIVRIPRPKVVVEGLGGDVRRLSSLATRGVEKTLHLAQSALSMLATAYTANCSGCSGMTASGVRAGFGVVAVDPSVIPLGTRMYIPGYGRAVAGDTGGDIHGRRIDLGFETNDAALAFGSRPVQVYLLK
jgi:3D (Asp-Asp-Asp) domain-containing protein